MARSKKSNIFKKGIGLALGLAGCIVIVEAVPLCVWYIIFVSLVVALISLLLIH